MTQPKRPDKPLTPTLAWQPFTPRGVAAFAHATFTRLFLVQVTLALLVATTCVWFVTSQWFPVVTEAIRELPDRALIRRGSLNTSATQATRLAENPRLALVLDPLAQGIPGHVSDLEVTLRQQRVEVCGVFGCASFAYPAQYVIGLSREEFEPWWGAWRSPLALMFGVAIAVVLLLAWWMVVLVTAPLVKLIGFFADRQIGIFGSLRVAAASLLPGTLIIVLVVVLYAFGALDALRLLLAVILYIVCSTLFLASSSVFLPKAKIGRGQNPFASEPGAKAKKSARLENPFSSERDS